jgi:tRNA/rRNA methyltransferase
MADLEGLIGQFDESLENAGYYFPPERTPATRATIRTILTKPQWSSREINALRGMLRALTTIRSSKNS